MNRVAVLHRPGLAYEVEPVRNALENLFRTLGLDQARAGTPDWNPLGDRIAPGDQVVVKPNLVSSRSRQNAMSPAQLQASCTHGSLLRPVLEYALRAVGPRGSVTVVDAPLEGCALDEVMGPLGVRAVLGELGVDFLDLRRFRLERHMLLDGTRLLGRSCNLGVLAHRRLPGDPRGSVTVDLGERSRFVDARVDPARLCFHRSHRHDPAAHHSRGRHEYSIPRTILEADVIISLPKLKTHKKAGVTLGLKSAIGLSDQKYWLPHFTEGAGGDEYERAPRVRERIEDRLSRLTLPGGHALIAWAPRIDRAPRAMDGSWQGNDTLWRTILDLNTILTYADRDGCLRPEAQRRSLTIVDGIVGGDREGPLEPRPVPAGLLLAGFDPVLVDREAARLMGFDPTLIPHLAHAGAGPGVVERRLDGAEPALHFEPPRSWPRLRSPSESA